MTRIVAMMMVLFLVIGINVACSNNVSEDVVDEPVNEEVDATNEEETASEDSDYNNEEADEEANEGDGSHQQGVEESQSGNELTEEQMAKIFKELYEVSIRAYDNRTLSEVDSWLEEFLLYPLDYKEYYYFIFDRQKELGFFANTKGTIVNYEVSHLADSRFTVTFDHTLTGVTGNGGDDVYAELKSTWYINSNNAGEYKVESMDDH